MEHVADNTRSELDELLNGTRANDDGDWTERRKVWRVREIATELHLAPRTVRYWIEGGLLRAQRTDGGHYRVEARELRQFLNGHPSPLAA